MITGFLFIIELKTAKLFQTIRNISIKILVTNLKTVSKKNSQPEHKNFVSFIEVVFKKFIKKGKFKFESFNNITRIRAKLWLFWLLFKTY